VLAPDLCGGGQELTSLHFKQMLQGIFKPTSKQRETCQACGHIQIYLLGRSNGFPFPLFHKFRLTLLTFSLDLCAPRGASVQMLATRECCVKVQEDVQKLTPMGPSAVGPLHL